MNDAISRRDALKGLGAVGVGALLGSRIVFAQGAGIQITGKPVEISVSPVSEYTARISAVPIENGQLAPMKFDGALIQKTWAQPSGRFTVISRERAVRCGSFEVVLSPDPLTISVNASDGNRIQHLRIDNETGSVDFMIGEGLLLGMGQGGPQFDRRGSTDRMRSGQGGYRLRTHGGRVPISWMIGTSGWAMFIHQPYGTFDFTGETGKFTPHTMETALPLDIFVITAGEPVQIMAEYARLTGYPELPPLWAFGYQQSHRTLSGPDEVLSVARTFREKKLPCDTLIYLGTGFCPSGWNTENGSFTFNPAVFPEPQKLIDELHAMNFRVVLHDVIFARSLRGTVHDPYDPEQFVPEEAASYWNRHREVFSMGIDGWWPDEGDSLNAESRLTRNRMHWEGPQVDRPNERPYALHRNGYAGMQRYAAFLWSGDVYTTWETLQTHVSVAINTGLSGIPYWGTDIGGFVPTSEYTGELHVRWFQFGAFCPLFRAHGRTWHLRLPWGWNTGELGHDEITDYRQAANPDPSELNNPDVEPICSKYLELRYRLMPYLYTTVYEGSRTNLPIIRALWLHYPDDAAAVERGDEYLWGRDILVAPVTEKGAASRELYLPRGTWYDFWTEERCDGGRPINRPVDLATMPLYVRAGAIIPLAPAKQFTDEKADNPLTLQIYPGADGVFTLFEDDGKSFNYRSGEWMGIRMIWNDRGRRLTAELAEGSKMLPPVRREIEVRLVPEERMQTFVFEGQPVEIQL
ncbi:TIM-barrel domain-containing protein [candidate division KSB1 bacterium]